MTKRFLHVVVYGLFGFILAFADGAKAKSYIAHTSDSTDSSVICCLDNEASIFRKHSFETYLKTHKDDSIKVMQKYTRGLPREILEGAYAVNTELLAEDTYPTLDCLKQTLEVQAVTDPRAAKAKTEDFVELRFVKEMKMSGCVDKLCGRK